MKRTFGNGELFFAIILICILGLFVTQSRAALIQSISFKGGGCIMNDDPGDCINADYVLDENAKIVYVTKNFSKVEGENEEEGGSGKKGNCLGQGGAPEGVGQEDSGETHEHEMDFEKLAPIHMFITLKNSANLGGDTYFFSESISNSMKIDWDGFFFALKQDEDNRALFAADPIPTSNYFTEIVAKGKKLTFSGDKYCYDLLVDPLTFAFSITFYDVSADLLRGDGTFSVMLQEFPLVSAAPVPEPSTLILCGAGLAVLSRFSRRKNQ